MILTLKWYAIRRGGFIAAFVFWGPDALAAQSAGIEAQAYPAGLILAARVDVGSHWSGFGGINVTDRRDFGEHDREEGNGFGGGIAWRQPLGRSGFQAGVRLDIWRLSIDWGDLVQGGRIGNTRVTVLQPTARVDRGFRVAGFVLRAGAAFGMEMNVQTDGEPVGEGPILLLGLAVLFPVR